MVDFVLCLVRPTVSQKFRRVNARINSSIIINCTVIRANPFNIQYTVNGLPPSIIRYAGVDATGSHYSVEIMPTSIEHFHSFNITANNSVGSDTCTYQLLHGGKYDRFN